MSSPFIMEWRANLQRLRFHKEAWRLPNRVTHAGRQWLDCCVELLFPSVCLLCAQPASNGDVRICVDCQTALTESGTLRCPRCAKPLPKYATADFAGCPLCRGKRLRFEQAIALGTYGNEVRELVLRIKQSRYESLCLAAGEMLAKKIRVECGADGLPDVVVPVPMHWLRKILRGTNDAEVLAEAVANHLRVPLSTNSLCCLRPTRKQGTLLPTERKLNVRGAYAVKRKTRIDQTHVLIVDDVMTTGATANELAKVLHRAGAARVTVAVIARGIGFD